MRKGQLQLQETIFVVLIFVVIILVALVFYYRFQMQSIQSDARDYQREKLNTLLLTLPDTSELSCSAQGQQQHCVDTIKLLAFQQTVRKDSCSFFKRYGYMNITFFSVYPESSSLPCTSSQVRDCGIWNVYTRLPSDTKILLDKTILESPVSLYYPAQDSYAIGKLVVEVYGV